MSDWSSDVCSSDLAAAAVALGARVFEKHLTLDRSMKGPDHSYALEPAELKAYVQTVSDAYAALGSPAKAMLDDERKVGRRNGLYAARAIAAGSELGAGDIVLRRTAVDRKSTRLNSSHLCASRLPSSACNKNHIITFLHPISFIFLPLYIH